MDPPREQATEARDLCLQRVLGRGRGFVAPQLVDESVPRHETVGFDEEYGEQRARTWSA
jgi:hypothetical protein